MIVRDFDVVSIVIMPNKTDSILVIDADAVLSIPIPFELFEAIARRNFQVVKVSRCIQHRKFSFRYTRGGRPSSLARSPDFRRFLCGETLDHASIITSTVNNVNRYYSSGDSKQVMLYSFAKWLNANSIPGPRSSS